MDHTRRRQLAKDIERAVLVVCRDVSASDPAFEGLLETAIARVVDRYFPDTPIPPAPAGDPGAGRYRG